MYINFNIKFNIKSIWGFILQFIYYMYIIFPLASEENST